MVIDLADDFFGLSCGADFAVGCTSGEEAEELDAAVLIESKARSSAHVSGQFSYSERRFGSAETGWRTTGTVGSDAGSFGV